jgi:RsiW-degrading membrane proteinase PrsW (M82 family)
MACMGLRRKRKITSLPPSRRAAPVWFVVFFAFVPPVTEELIKVIPLLIPPARRLVKRGIGAFSAGMALGIGFGLGEALYLAYNVSNNFMYLDIPWYQFSGYTCSSALQRRFCMA